MNKKFITSIIIGLVICVNTFIYISNDHVECRNVVKHSVGENGEKISIAMHVCKEKFSF